MNHFTTDILVIGAGAAGIRAAIEASKAGLAVTVVADTKPTNGGSTFSGISGGWGIQALEGDERTADNLEAFYDDIMRVGLDRCDPQLVRILVEESGARIRDLISYGLAFKTGADGKPVRAQGCFSKIKRAFLTRDMINIRRTFSAMLRQTPIGIVTGDVTDLIVDDCCCLGAWIMPKGGGHLQINAKSTILATGGGSAIFKDHMSSGGGCGAGYALAHGAGAELANLEFIQFALGLKNNGTRQFLPSWELDQPNKIVDSSGSDILHRILPDSGQRSKAVDLRRTHMPFSCRDLSGLLDIAVAQARQTDKHLYWRNGHSEDDRFEVVHFAHAFNGGVKINARAESTIEGLFAAGEVAAGAHGADRIGGCMMTATQVFGQRAGHFAARRAVQIGTKKMLSRNIKRIKPKPSPDRKQDVEAELDAIESCLKATMSRYAGVLRTKEGLEKARALLESCQTRLNTPECTATGAGREYFRVRNMVTTAHLVVQSALARDKSLGSHYRSDDNPAE